MDNNGLTRAFTASEAAAVETRLWGLLQRQVQHYTMAESSSVPVEVAQELLKGVNALLQQGLQGVEDRQAQLLYGDLVEYMEQQIKAAGIEKHRIIAELTESANPRQSDQLEHFLNGCTRLGIDVALDDFGKGYSSINMLLKYPFRIVKLAKELIVESTASAENEKFITAIVNICQQNGKQICAEGVETEEQYNAIRKIGCDMIQGFYFYHPMDEKSLIDVMIRQNHSSDQ